MDNKTQLIDLNADCLLLVLQRLDFASLISVAESNQHLKSIVSIILEQMLRNKMVIIAHSTSYLQTFILNISEYENNIKIRNLEIAEQMLKNSGHLIRNLTIDNAYEAMINSTRLIYKLVNVHCSKTLTGITLLSSKNNFLEEFTNRFENVEIVSLHDGLKTNRRLAHANSSLKDIYISIGNSIEAESILQLVGGSKQLERLQIVFSTIDIQKSTAEILRKRITNMWSLDTLANSIILKKSKIGDEVVVFSNGTS